MSDQLKESLTRSSTWMRGVFMLLFVVIYGFAEAIWFLVVVFQFVHALVTGKPNLSLMEFSENLCAYIYEILLFLSFNTEERPFPFAPWPAEGHFDDGLTGAAAVDDGYGDDDFDDDDDKVDGVDRTGRSANDDANAPEARAAVASTDTATEPTHGATTDTTTDTTTDNQGDVEPVRVADAVAPSADSPDVADVTPISGATTPGQVDVTPQPGSDKPH
jgi:hypothetical protein